jgi:hypothetical protein
LTRTTVTDVWAVGHLLQGISTVMTELMQGSDVWKLSATGFKTCTRTAEQEIAYLEV